jgi:predicted ATPase
MLTLMAWLYLGSRRGDLLLVDEPELSQHLVWQKAWLSRLIGHAQSVGFDAIVATHSPDLIQGQRNLMRPLMSAEDTAHES